MKVTVNIAGLDAPAVGQLDSHRSAATEQDSPRLGAGQYLAAMLADIGHQGVGQPRRAAQAHLGFVRAGQHGGDAVAEAAQAQIDLAQAVKEQ